MNPLIQCKPTILPLFVAGVLACFGPLSGMRAVVPAPDGGYPGGNTAEGQNALLSLTTGSFNTAVGWFSLQSNTTTNFNTALGAGTLLYNVAETNTAIGAGALLFNTTGEGNTAAGTQALFSNDTGSANTATGDAALYGNIEGSNNTATGTAALFFNIGSRNTASGRSALFDNTTGGDNTATGYSALFNNTSGDFNTATGTDALVNNTTGSHNTALGYFAGSDVTGIGNVCIGANVNGDAGVDDTTWIKNVNHLTQNFAAGVNDYVTVRLTDGRLGHTAVVSSRRYKEDIKPLAAASESLYALKPVSFRLKKEFDEMQALGFGLIAEEVEKVDPALVYRNNKGQAESVRYEMINAMLLNEFLKAHGKIEEQQKQIGGLSAQLKQQAAQIQKISGKGTEQFGLIAEEIAEASPDLMVRDKNGEIYTVRYDAMNAMVLNEFLKAHRRMEEQEATISKQQKQIDALISRVQKASAQLELSKPAPQTVLNDQ
jgi:hypothetical protein